MELMGPGLARRSGFVARWAALKASEAFAALLEFARVCLKGGLAIAGQRSAMGPSRRQHAEHAKSIWMEGGPFSKWGSRLGAADIRLNMFAIVARMKGGPFSKLFSLWGRGHPS